MRFKGLKTEVFRLAAPLGLWAKAAPRPMGRPMGSSEAPMPVDLASRMLEPEDTGEPLSMPSHKAKRHQVVNSTSFYTPWHLGLLVFVRGASSCIEDAIRGRRAIFATCLLETHWVIKIKDFTSFGTSFKV